MRSGQPIFPMFPYLSFLDFSVVCFVCLFASSPGCFVVTGMVSRASHLLGKHSTPASVSSVSPACLPSLHYTDFDKSTRCLAPNPFLPTPYPSPRDLFAFLSFKEYLKAFTVSGNLPPHGLHSLLQPGFNQELFT